MGNGNSRFAKPKHGEAPKASKPNHAHRQHVSSSREDTVLAENLFQSMLTLERRRAERSGKPFVLMLLAANPEGASITDILKDALNVIVESKRETDLAGWYKKGAILGIIFTEINTEWEQPISSILGTKMEKALIKHLGRESAGRITISLHMFPEGSGKDQLGWVANSKLYPDLDRKVSRKRFPLVIRRAITIVGGMLRPEIVVLPF